MRFSTFITCLLFCVTCSSQNINGIWKGRLVQGPGGCFPVYNIEMHIQIAATRITGTSYHYADTSNFVREEFEGTYDPLKNEILINETNMISFHIPYDCVPCIKSYSLSFHKGGNEEQLRGSWSGTTLGNKTTCPPGTLVLTRTVQPDFKPEIKLPSTLTQRKNELVKEIKVDTGTIRLDFYDNGIIDGDSISVYVNNIPVITNKMLTTKPITTYVRIELNKPEQEVIMVGENLGSIPPNTALMIVTAGEERYLLYLVSDEKKNALVRFLYENPIRNKKNMP